MGKYTYTYFMKQIESKKGHPGVEFWFPDWTSFPPSRVYLADDKEIMLYIRYALFVRCKLFEMKGRKFPVAKNYFNVDLPLNVAMQAITVDTESE